MGIVYSSGLEPLLEAHPELVDVVEIEPQTLWVQTDDPVAPYDMRPGVLARLADLPGHKLVHSIGTPVGGSVRAHAAQIPLLRATIAALGAPWASEHLSFNLTPDFFTGFFLPPRQTAAGVAVYADAIRRLQADLGVPLAIETPVSYLRPRADEIADGAFVGMVADAADCGILLDLHNVYCNERNGRQPCAEFVAQLPTERVWELHLAGGFELQGFWLDAHSGAIPDPLVRRARELIPTLPNVRAMIFELFPSFLERFGLDRTVEQLQVMRELWSLRGHPTSEAARLQRPQAVMSAPGIDPPEWESALGRVVIGRALEEGLDGELAGDPGARLIQGLVKEFRGSMVVGVYRLTCRLLMLALGTDVFRLLLEDFWADHPPQQFAATEGDAFVTYVEGKEIAVPQLQSILEFERATLATLRDGQSRVARFSFDPFPLLRALNQGELPDEPGRPGAFEIELTDEGPLRTNGSAYTWPST